MFRVASVTAATRRSGSTQNLAAQGLPGKVGRGKAVHAANPAWPLLLWSHWRQYLALLVGFLVLSYTDHATPFRRSVYHITDAELWRYSYPLLPNRVPAWAVPVYSFFTPLLVIALFHLSGRISRLAAHHGLVQAWGAVVITGLITNLVKLNVARPRPNFVARCWPGGAERSFSPSGVPLCAAGALDWEEGLKSFPSGHTAWSAAGLGYISLWLLGALRCFEGGARPTRLAAALLPICFAAWVGMTRMQDCWHHTEDVAAGYALGMAIAWLCYRAVHAPMVGPQAGMLTLLCEDGGAGGAARDPGLALATGSGLLASGTGLDSTSNLPGLMGSRFNALTPHMPEEDV